MPKPVLAAAAVAALLALGGCTSSYSANTIDGSSVGNVNRVVGGTVLSARNVTIKSDGNQYGTGIGAVAGAVGGSALGSSTREGILGGIAGAVIGGLAGSVAGGAVGNETGAEYIIRLDDGQTVTVVQGVEPVMASGQRILVVYDRRRTRVIPDGSNALATTAAPAQPATTAGATAAGATTAATPLPLSSTAPAVTSVQTVGPVVTQATPRP